MITVIVPLFRFRITINMNVEKYNSLKSRHERSKFIASLAHTMRYEVGFRFLKKKNGKNSETIDLTDDEVRAKIGHALRDLSTVLRENGADETNSEDAKVPRPGPYKKQDKQALQTAVSSESLETVPTENLASAASIEEDCKPAAPVSSAAALSPVQEDQESNGKKKKKKKKKKFSEAAAAAPDQVRSSSPPLEQLISSSADLLLAHEEVTPLKSNQQIKSLSKIFDSHNHEDLKLFPLEVGNACESLLAPPAESLLPSLDDDLDGDEYWTHAELQNERSSRRSQRTAMSIGTFDMLSNTEQSGRSQRTAMSVGTFDMSLNSSCCLSDAIETLSLVST